jgi:hypothetical protein
MHKGYLRRDERAELFGPHTCHCSPMHPTPGRGRTRRRRALEKVDWQGERWWEAELHGRTANCSRSAPTAARATRFGVIDVGAQGALVGATRDDEPYSIEPGEQKPRVCLRSV